MKADVSWIENTRTGTGNVFRICGLSIFEENAVPCRPALDPRLQLLDYITGRSERWHGLIGDLAMKDLADRLDEIVRDKTTNLYETDSHIGLHGGDFNYYREAVLGHIVTGRGEISATLEEADLLYIVDYGGIAIGISDNPGAEWPNPDLEYFSEGLLGSQDIEGLIPKDGYLIAYGHDGIDAYIYTSSPVLPVLVGAGLVATSNTIRQSAWYMTNAPKLVWADMEQCLMLRN